MKKVRYDCRPTERQAIHQITNAPKGPKSEPFKRGAGRVQPDNRQSKDKQSEK